MNIKKVNLVYFSPTETTKKVVTSIAETLLIKETFNFDITKEEKSTQLPLMEKDSLTIIAAPVYSGRLPTVAANRLKKLKAKDSPCVVIAVYGNRDYDDTLLELKDIALECGFKVIAAGAFIGEHSFATDKKQIAMNRPDNQDLIKIKEFTNLIVNKIKNCSYLDNFKPLELKGNFPYKEKGPLPPVVPTTNPNNCTLCKMCEDVCPVDAITITNKVITNIDACIWCCACVKVCNHNARNFDDPLIDGKRDWLLTNCSNRKEPEFFV